MTVALTAGEVRATLAALYCYRHEAHDMIRDLRKRAALEQDEQIVLDGLQENLAHLASVWVVLCRVISENPQEMILGMDQQRQAILVQQETKTAMAEKQYIEKNGGTIQ